MAGNPRRISLEIQESIKLLNEPTKKRLVTLTEIDSIMEMCIRMIEKASPTALKTIEAYIHCDCDTYVKKQMSLWTDDYNLNLVHYAIIYKRPGIVNYLLTESCVFPPRAHPCACPYAHLAAFVGAPAVIKVILNQRPKDYFKACLPEHDIVLPSHIILQFNLNRFSQKQAKLDDVLKSINYFKKSTEMKSSGLDQSDDLNDLIEHLQSICVEKIEVSQGKVAKKRMTSISRERRRHTLIKRPKRYSELFQDFTKEATLHSQNTIGKTPLAIAAEACNTDAVNAILYNIGKIRKSVTYGPLIRATKAISPEAIALLLDTEQISKTDYQDSVLEAIRELLPECLIALLSNPPRKFNSAFGGMNLYHMLYTQCLDADDDRYQMLPLMTRALVYCKQDVNSYTLRQTFPLYSLISSSFNVNSTKKLYSTFECLRILLSAGANPIFDETTAKPTFAGETAPVGRSAYKSAWHCVFENVMKSIQVHENPDMALVVMKHTILLTLEMSKSRFKSLNEVLFQYMERACYLSLDKQILSKMLKFGVDPNVLMNNKYALNVYFEELFKYALQSERIQSHDYYKKEMGILMILCQQMRPEYLREAVRTILHQYVTGIPIEAVAVTRYFLYLVESLVKHTYFQ